MALISGLFAFVGRLAGRIVNASLGWATILLFGKVSGTKQTVLSLIALGSLAWVIVLLGVLVPAVAVFLLAAIPLPPFVDQTWIRIGMLVAAIGIPLLVGVAAIWVAEPAKRPKGAGLVVGVLRGYPFTLLLAVTIGFLAVVALIRRVVSATKQRQDAHVALIVKPGGYDRVLSDLREVLNRAGLPVRPVPAPAILSIPPKLLDKIAGPSLGALVPDRLMLLQAPEIDVLVYPSDLAISGTKIAVARARAAMAARLTSSPAYLTTTAEAERVEDEIRKIAPGSGVVAAARFAKPGGLTRLDAIDRELATLTVDFDEWETLYRERLQVERDLLTAQGASTNQPAAAPVESARSDHNRRIAMVGMALVAADILVAIIDRLAPSRPGTR
jgi:hypothetical protein